MSVVLVETELPVANYGCWRNNIPYLDLVAEAVPRLGKQTHRWIRGPRIQIPPKTTHAFLWGSEHSSRCMKTLRRAGVQPIHLDWGWTFDRFENLQMDKEGNGGTASWADERLPWESKGPLFARSSGDILVCLRYEGQEPICTDPITTPYFHTNAEWLRHLCRATPLSLRARFHYAYSQPLRERLQKEFRRRVTWDTSPNFRAAASTAQAVAVIDSTAGVQALELGLPLFCFGRQVFRHPGVCYCLTNDLESTTDAFAELSAGGCLGVDEGAVEAMLMKIRAKQWNLKDKEEWPDRLRREFGL